MPEIKKSESYHVPIMLDEVINALKVKPGGIYLDGTLGGGGHTEAILDAGGRVTAIDKDAAAIGYAGERLKKYRDKLSVIRADFKEAERVLSERNITALDGALLDLGISSKQIDDAERGFSYMQDAALDMRMDRRQYLTAHEVVNGYDEKRLIKIFRDYGEEDFAGKIAAAIVRERANEPIKTTGRLTEIIKGAVPLKFQFGSHPAKKVFQAIRIEVNGELDGLDGAIRTIAARLKKGGRFCVITFHSLEDRIVKQAFKLLATDCICDKSLPICVCGHKASLKLFGKPVTASETEIKANSRAASAKLRIAEKL